MASTTIIIESVVDRQRGHNMECRECGGCFNAGCFRNNRQLVCEVRQCFESHMSINYAGGFPRRGSRKTQSSTISPGVVDLDVDVGRSTIKIYNHYNHLTSGTVIRSITE